METIEDVGKHQCAEELLKVRSEYSLRFAVKFPLN